MIDEQVKGATRKKKKGPISDAADRRKDVISYLSHLRTTGKELCRSISSDIEKDVIDAIELASAVQAKEGRKKNNSAALEKAASILERLTIKPEKGRRGDLKKIEKAMRSVKEALSHGKTD